MSFWPSDTAGRIADGITAVGFLVSVAGGVFAKMRGSAADKAAKAADQAVQELRQEFLRREMLPLTARLYEKLYLELVPLLNTVLNTGTDPSLVTQKLGELRGTLNGLEKYLHEGDKGTLTIVIKRLDLIQAEPNDSGHLQVLLQNAATLATELNILVKAVKWNNQS